MVSAVRLDALAQGLLKPVLPSATPELWVKAHTVLGGKDDTQIRSDYKERPLRPIIDWLVSRPQVGPSPEEGSWRAVTGARLVVR